MATLIELKAQIKTLKDQVDALQAIYDQFGNIEETPVGRVYAIKFKPGGVSEFLIELFWKNTSDTWRSTFFYGAKTTSEVVDIFVDSVVEWVRKVGSVNAID